MTVATPVPRPQAGTVAISRPDTTPAPRTPGARPASLHPPRWLTMTQTRYPSLPICAPRATARPAAPLAHRTPFPTRTVPRPAIPRPGISS
jgi:hypothetical protein